jgi:death-on-curing family protein
LAISWDEVVLLYRTILRETGGEFGFVSEGTLRFILDAVNGMSGDVFTKAAYAIHEIAVKHPLVNGNKRLALALGKLLIKREGYELRLDVQETTIFMLGVARDEASKRDIAEWLRNRSKKTR